VLRGHLLVVLCHVVLVDVHETGTRPRLDRREGVCGLRGKVLLDRNRHVLIYFSFFVYSLFALLLLVVGALFNPSQILKSKETVLTLGHFGDLGVRADEAGFELLMLVLFLEVIENKAIVDLIWR